MSNFGNSVFLSPAAAFSKASFPGWNYYHRSLFLPLQWVLRRIEETCYCCCRRRRHPLVRTKAISVITLSEFESFFGGSVNLELWDLRKPQSDRKCANATPDRQTPSSFFWKREGSIYWLLYWNWEETRCWWTRGTKKDGGEKKRYLVCIKIHIFLP